MLRLVDQPRPLVWAVGALASPYYRALWEMRHLPDWQRIAVRRACFARGQRFLYMHAPKSASSSVRSLLAHALRGSEPRAEIHSGPLYWREVLPLLDASDVYRFSFVVHPVTRAVAAFNDLFVTGRNPYGRRHWPQTRLFGLRFGDSSGANFDRYLAYVADAQTESAQFCDPHFRLQSRNLLVDHLNYARIGHVETFEADMTSILADIGLGAAVTAETFAADRRNALLPQIFHTPDATQIARIHGLYEEDFDRFGYSRELA